MVADWRWPPRPWFSGGGTFGPVGAHVVTRTLASDGGRGGTAVRDFWLESRHEDPRCSDREPTPRCPARLGHVRANGRPALTDSGSDRHCAASGCLTGWDLGRGAGGRPGPDAAAGGERRHRLGELGGCAAASQVGPERGLLASGPAAAGAVASAALAAARAAAGRRCRVLLHRGAQRRGHHRGDRGPVRRARLRQRVPGREGRRGAAFPDPPPGRSHPRRPAGH